MAKFGCNNEKYLLKNTRKGLYYSNIISLLRCWLQKKKKKNVSSIVRQHNGYQLMCKSANPYLASTSYFSKTWIYVSKTWRLQTPSLSTLFAKNLSKFKIMFSIFFNSHHRNKFTSLFTTVMAIFFLCPYFFTFSDFQNVLKMLALEKELFFFHFAVYHKTNTKNIRKILVLFYSSFLL